MNHTSYIQKHVSPCSAQHSVKKLERDDFMKDIHDLFSRQKAGHVGSWQYSVPHHHGDAVRGSQYWEAFISHASEYYPYHEESQIIQENYEDICAHIADAKNLVDMGTGGIGAYFDKIHPILSNHSNISSYCPIDVSKQFLTEGYNYFTKTLTHIDFTPHKCDFFKEPIPKFDQKSCYALLGNTICNVEGDLHTALPEEMILDNLRHFKHNMKESYLLISQDSNHDDISLDRAYSYPYHKEFGRNLMHRIFRDLPVEGDYDPKGWTYVPHWDPKNNRLAHTVIATKDHSFSISGRPYDVQFGERFVLNNSYKMPQQDFIRLCEKAGFKHMSTFSLCTKRVHLHLLQA